MSEEGRTVRVGSELGGYPVRVEPGLLDRLPSLLESHAPASAYAVVADGTVAERYGRPLVERLQGAGATAFLLSFPPGEASKTRATWAELTDALLAEGLDRRGVVVALGGGVTGDLAGFVAATYLRGVRVVQVPTSLVAMVDSSVGGKTGVDAPAGKNLVGAFHPPVLVAVDPRVIRTLPREQRAQGLAEAIKHGAILDQPYLEAIHGDAGDLLEGDPASVGELVARSVELKARVVSRDEQESGLRRILNFGHTVGHAVEAVSGYRVPHGSAVALGMACEAHVGEALEVTIPGTARRLETVLEAAELPVRIPEALDLEDVLRATRVDKKGAKGRGRYVLLRGLGEVDPGVGWVHDVDEGVVRDVLASPGEGGAG